MRCRVFMSYLESIPQGMVARGDYAVYSKEVHMFRKITVLILGLLVLVVSCKAPSTEPATYTVTYDGNKSDGGTVPVDTAKYKEGQSVTVAGNTGNLTRTDYQFTGWNTEPDGSGTNRTSGQSFSMGDDDVVLYAKWSTFEFIAAAASEPNGWHSVSYANGLFVAVSRNGDNRVMTSPNGITWTARAAAENNGWRSVTYGNGLFVAVAEDGTNRVMTSPDGITWTARAAAEANSWVSVTSGDGLFVAVATDGTNRVMTSHDGITWTARAAAEANSWMSVTYGDGLFVAVASDGTNRVMTSEWAP